MRRVEIAANESVFASALWGNNDFVSWRRALL